MRKTTLRLAATTLLAACHDSVAFIPSSKVINTFRSAKLSSSTCQQFGSSNLSPDSQLSVPKHHLPRLNPLALFNIGLSSGPHHRLTAREIIFGSSPLVKFVRYSRTRVGRWLRGKRRKNIEGEEGSGITKGFVDASHSAWARRFCTIYIGVYLLLSVTAYSFFFEKQWSIIDSLYFAVTTFTSVGYGDLVPSTKGGKLFTVFFAIYGLSILGIALTIVGRNLVEAEGHAVEAAEQRIVDALHGRLHQHNETFATNTTDGATSGFSVPADGIQIPHAHHVTKPSFLSVLKKLFLTQTPNIILILLLAGFMGRREGWGWWTSVYYCFITTTTVGLGDIAPSTQAMRLFAVFFIPLSVAVLGEILSVLGGWLVTDAAHKAEHDFMSREMTVEDLEVLDTEHKGNVTEVEFLSHMLVTMEKVDQDLIDEIRELFVSLDAQENGVLEKRDLEILAQRRKNRMRQIGSTVRRGEFV